MAAPANFFYEAEISGFFDAAVAVAVTRAALYRKLPPKYIVKHIIVELRLEIEGIVRRMQF